ncbi:hypothetical protein ORV05_04535 [Amycolatopsis cynarae]|uniref:PPE domain-containing protein n=1 Tax=Amycolatopsis cynarae TaxID=2995223 RepID=A0ABY7B415_9PSEU|nr:hypothetical protein [Amycolatopsis sp. HUAS 11-8]WAL67060.1 hypothetical protein ORV05_04535 [Amycolatopsis sp. HUAS 11-8]
MSGELYEQKVAAEGGGYRGGLTPSDLFYHALPHETLILMVHDGVSPEHVDEQGMIVNDLGNAFKELAAELRQAASKEAAGWQGEGARSAFGYLAAYSAWAESSGDAAFLAANRYSQTAAALSHARNSMPEPAGRTVTQSLDVAQRQLAGGDLMGAVGTYRNMMAQANLAMRAQQQAVAVVAQRDRMLYSCGSTQPIYAAPPQLESFTAPAPAAPVGDPGGRPAAVPNFDHTAASAFTPSPPVLSPGPATSAAGSPPVVIQVSDGIGTGSGPSTNPPIAGREVGGWSRLPGSTLDPGVSAGLLPIVGGTGPGGGLERGGSSRSGDGPGRAADRSPGGAEREPGAGKRSGTAGPGAKVAGEAARNGAAGKPGKAGSPGVPGVAGGGRKGEEDKEHQRAAFLVEADPGAALGLEVDTDKDGNKIAPPVLGE